MSRLLDITDDTSRRYYLAYTGKIPMPEYVKSAEVLEKEQVDSLPSSAFADPVHRKFATHTKADCWCSCLYFYGGQHNLNPMMKQAEQRLITCAGIWGIYPDLLAIKAAFVQQETPVTYALDTEYRGKVLKRCPDHTKEAATKSAGWLYENRYAYPVHLQKLAATRLYERADLEALPQTTRIYLEKLAHSERYSAINSKVSAAIVSRLCCIPHSRWGEFGDTLLKLSESLSANPSGFLSEPEVVMTAIEQFDIDSRQHSKWGSDVAYPLDVCYDFNVVKAAETTKDTVYLVTGTPVNLDKIGSDQLVKGLRHAGDTFVSYCQPDGINLDKAKVAELLPTLPRPEARRFEDGIKTAGYVIETSTDVLKRLI